MRAIGVSAVVVVMATVAAGAPSWSARGAAGLRGADFKPRCGSHGWLGNVLDTSHIYLGGEVDKPSTPESGNPAPHWPSASSYSSTGTTESDSRYGGTAQVIARFVVDTMECVDSSSFKVVQSTDSAFTMSVRHVLAKLRYRPARKDGRNVRSWVLWKFVFVHENGAEPPT